ncbi:MAG: hypothetical protein R3Y07_00955 [Eubacteriales bacterium]
MEDRYAYVDEFLNNIGFDTTQANITQIAGVSNTECYNDGTILFMQASGIDKIEKSEAFFNEVVRLGGYNLDNDEISAHMFVMQYDHNVLGLYFMNNPSNVFDYVEALTGYAEIYRVDIQE